MNTKAEAMNIIAEVGRSGNNARSDCRVRIELKPSGGRSLDLRSKVEVLYGRSNLKLVDEVLTFFDIVHADVLIEDSGALPFTLAARVEAAVKRLYPDERREYLLPATVDMSFPSTRDRFRRSRLYLPGNDPKLAINAGIFKPDGIILDLEDSVAASEKDAARILVRNVLRAVDFYGAERMLRINQGEAGFADLDAVIPQFPQLILIPKCESAQQVRAVAGHIEEFAAGSGIFLMPIIESARGALLALEIAEASPNIVALAIGLEDYTADIGAERTPGGSESFWMRGMVLNAAKATGVQAIDTVFSDVSDTQGLLASVREAKSLGFDGKGCIHPRQVDVVHQGYAPSEAEIVKAKKIVTAFDHAQTLGLGVVSLGSKMIDPPVVKRALRTITIAVASGLLPAGWKEDESHE